MNESGTDNPGGDRPTEKMSGAGPPGGGLRGRLGALMMALRENPLYAGTAAGVILIAVAVLVVASLIGGDGGGGSETGASRYVTIHNVGSSWTNGQTSLASYGQFDAIAGRANVLGENAQSSYWKGQLQYDTDQIEARKRAAERARQAYLKARHDAEVAYQKKLAEAKAKQRAALRKQKAKQAALLRALRRKYQIKPGEECSLPEIRARFDCSTGYPF